MVPLTLDGDTLGEKQKHFNKLVHDAVSNKQINLPKINYDDTDIHNLLHIHIACKTKNVDYIIEVLKCDDMLYISTAIKQSTWLITDQEYAHIINPEYLYTQLFPHMLTQGINKLLLHIRLHLKDEKRVEVFYEYIKETFSNDEAEKWLLNCSISFIEHCLQKDLNISIPIYKRLCRRSVKFLPYYTKVKGRNEWQALNATSFLIKSHTEEYLNTLDNIKDYCIPHMGTKHTELIMKKYPERILDNFQKYIDSVDLQIVAKYIKKEDIKAFILKHANNHNTKHYFNNYHYMQHFIKNMPKEDRFDFVKKICIDKMDDEMFCNINNLANSVKTYEWYQYATFSVALIELKKLIRAESSSAERCSMLSVLITCARKKIQHAKTVLEYYYDKHRNEPFKFKVQFVNNVITNMSTHEFDSDTWNILDNLFHSLEVYIESDKDVQQCVQAIVVYKVLHNENVPEVIERKIVYDRFVKCRRNLDEKQRNQIFDYLLKSICNKISNYNITTESDFDNHFNILKNAFTLLKHWQKDIQGYSFIRENLQELIKIMKQHSWQRDLSSLYDINKSWRKLLFEESVLLCPSERVCYNALKHEPYLLERYSKEMNELRTNDAVTMRQFLTKLRIYWPHSLAQQWTDAYLTNVDATTGQKALFKGLSVLLPQNQLIELAKKHVPNDFKIDWREIDQLELSLSKNIAKCLYMARPLTPLDVVLWYAKGDYLQYAVPSLNAILHNISRKQSRVYIPKFLEAPVSLQKYGIHLAFIKLDYEEVKSLFSNVWKTTNNLSIRSHLFINTYNLLCKVKQSSIAKDLWEVLNMFISNLKANENKEIFNKLANVEKVHICVQGEFYMKSYAFFTSLLPGVNCENQKDNLIRYAPNIMELLDSNFVIDKILAPIEQNISKPDSQFIDIISSYVLHGNTEQEQCERFRKVVVPALKHILAAWDLVQDEQYVMKNNFDALLRALTWDFRKYMSVKKIIVPAKVFSEMSLFMEQKMSSEENYSRCTSWKLITEYVELVIEHKHMLCDKRLNNVSLSDIGHKWMPDDVENVWEKLHNKLSPKFALFIVKHLKEDTDKYFPTICWLFSEALDTVFTYFSYNRSLMKMETFKHMIVDNDYIPSYIVVCNQLPRYGDEKENEKRVEIRKILSAHPSQEVQMHYQKAFGDIADSLS